MTTDNPKAEGPSPLPWSYDYNPYTLQDGRELPAFEIFDANYDRILETNEDSPAELQEANARLAAAAPSLRDALEECVRILADYDEADGDEGDTYRLAVEALQLCYDARPCVSPRKTN
jgi:hypothetical protein